MKKLILPLLFSAGLAFAQAGVAQPPAYAEYLPQDMPAIEAILPAQDAQQAMPIDAGALPQDFPAFDAYAPAYEEILQQPAIGGTLGGYEGYEYYNAEPLDALPRPEAYPDIDPNKVQGIIIQMPFTNITIKPPFAPYQTYDTGRLKSKRIPEMVSEGSLLQNLNKTSWRLKFYAHPDIQLMDSLLLDIAENDIMVTSIPKEAPVISVAPAVSSSNAPALPLQINESNQNISSYRLTLVKTLRPGEGIYAYDAGDRRIHFMYIRLLLPHLLAFDMAETYDKIALCPDKSLADMGVFTLE